MMTEATLSHPSPEKQALDVLYELLRLAESLTLPMHGEANAHPMLGLRIDVARLEGHKQIELKELKSIYRNEGENKQDEKDYNDALKEMMYYDRASELLIYANDETDRLSLQQALEKPEFQNFGDIEGLSRADQHGKLKIYYVPAEPKASSKGRRVVERTDFYEIRRFLSAATLKIGTSQQSSKSPFAIYATGSLTSVASLTEDFGIVLVRRFRGSNRDETHVFIFSIIALDCARISQVEYMWKFDRALKLGWTDSQDDKLVAPKKAEGHEKLHLDPPPAETTNQPASTTGSLAEHVAHSATNN